MLRTRVALLLCAVLPSAASAASVWTALATEKIRPTAAARNAPSVHISAARNEFEAFQVVVTGAATSVTATATPLTGPGTIAGVRLYREALINLQYASALDGGTGRWPDALVPDVDEFDGQKRNAFPFDVPAGESRAIFVDVEVPPGAPPGDYAGEIRLTWANGTATVPVTLTVWPFTLPSTSTLRSAFGFYYGAIPQGHGMGAGDAMSRLRARYGLFALDHRITLSGIDDGNFSVSHLESFYGNTIDGTAATDLAGAKMTAVQLMGDASSWASDFRTRGWLDRLFQYTCDEPPLTCAWSDIPARAKVAHAADPALRTLVTTTVQEATSHGVLGSIDILVPVINYLDDKPGQDFAGDQRGAYDGFLAASPLHELWTYQSCMSHGCGGTVNFGSPTAGDQYFTGWPSYVIDSSAVRNRALEWLSFRYGLRGELYYETAMAYAHDPWSNQWDFSGNGDGTLFYPGTPAKIGGTTHVPVASLRLKMIREGMEDHEYLALLARGGSDATAEAHAIADQLFPNAYSTEVSPEALMSARERIAQRIVARGLGDAAVATGDVPSVGGTSTGATASDGSSTGSAGSGGAVAAGITTGGGCAAGGGAGLGAAVAVAALVAVVRRRRR